VLQRQLIIKEIIEVVCMKLVFCFAFAAGTSWIFWVDVGRLD